MKDLTKLDDTRWGRLVVITSYLSQNASGSYEVLCQCKCDCGNLKVVKCGSLTAGLTRSCGCLRKEHINKVNNKLKRGHKLWK